MNKTHLILPIFFIIFIYCRTEDKTASVAFWEKEILAAEQAFSEMAQREGIPEAFLAFAAEDAVVKRDKTLIVGKAMLKSFYEDRGPSSGNVSLSWKPDFVDVSLSGDLGYTYGQYIYEMIDTNGVATTDTGIFHTVWKKQPDGEWKFVWD